ncbi:MAG: molybdenum ABC transporter ATP-binding protein [bacterium]|nr:molybdenum ABC transporter ATP-binding protein [bacterium]
MLKLRIHKSYADFRLDVDCISDAQITGVFGPSGSGKSTLLACIAGLTAPDSGCIKLNGATLFDGTTRANMPVNRRRIGYVPQDGVVFEHLTVEANLRYSRRSDESAIRFDPLVRTLELGDLLDRPAGEISGGQKRRVALGRALLSGPQLLLLDEPLVGLDRRLAYRTLTMLREVLREPAIPTLYVSHTISDILYLCDGTWGIDRGRVVNVGQPTRLFLHPQWLHDADFADLENLFEAEVIDRSPDDRLLRCRVGDAELSVATDLQLPPSRITLAVHARDIILSLSRPRDISARNVLRGKVTRVKGTPRMLIVFVDVGVEWMVELTLRAVNELEIKVGQPVYVIVKASAIFPIGSAHHRHETASQSG